MPELHYHPIYAWNLVWDLIQSKQIEPNQIGGYVHHQLATLALASQLTKDNQQISREMLVFADRVLLPGELDVPLPQHIRDAGHIEFWSSANQTLSEERWKIKRQEYTHDTLRLLVPMLLKAQDTQDSITDQQLKSLFDYWEECNKWEEDTRGKVNQDTWDAIDVMRSDPSMRHLLLSSQSDATRRHLLELLNTDPKRRERNFRNLQNA